MESSFKTSHACTAALTAHCSSPPRLMPLLETPGFSLANLDQSTVGSLLLSPGSWCAQAMFEPSEHFWWAWGLILKGVLPLLLSCWGFSLPLDVGYLLKVTPSTTPVPCLKETGSLEISSCPNTVPNTIHSCPQMLIRD